MIHTIQACTKDGSPLKLQGKRVFFKVGGKRHGFLLHDNTLTHYRSGYRIGDYRSIKVFSYRTYTGSLTDRAAASVLLERIVKREGVEQVNRVLDSAPVINP